MDLVILSNLAMFSLVIGTMPAFVSLIKSRTNLRGFSLIGTLGLLIGQTLYLIYFGLYEDYITMALCMPLVTYWILVLYFLIRKKLKRNG